MAFIRPYQESDFDDMSHICRETLPASLAASEPARRLAPYIWTHQYTLLSPSTCFVLDDGRTGRAVGYCIGCPEVPAFCAAYPRYVREVLDGRGRANGDVRAETRPPPEGEEGEDAPRAAWIDPDTGRISEAALAQLAFSPRRLLLDGTEDLLREGYRGTMHIDLLPEYQGKGWGRRLLEALVESMRPAAGGEAGEGEERSRGIWLGVGAENSKVVPFYEKLGFRVKEREIKTSTIIMVRDY
ncbi:Acyl-CoA N-acyltransferase [Cordyceps fumosorosea ARSEF 2679]|uniref:Acyl-CoA N-acyltransferase n=1 Tax=Cordyceps fumosorosea (strain ARSEF 2679) TaxID=1081104 RepID=A0A168BW52_CORFA|nr:Acyl-CoA N-acyltransferase [Cordyceps fumosorosea ARSEF 2679]OAA70623.1 Acyl-CoA N-acyltransferase [Cordyceps fumosorosea ARSEF 2679]